MSATSAQLFGLESMPLFRPVFAAAGIEHARQTDKGDRMNDKPAIRAHLSNSLKVAPELIRPESRLYEDGAQWLTLRIFNITRLRADLGLVTKANRRASKRTCVALPGLAAWVAPIQALAGWRGLFRLADPDSFEIANFNRQFGSTLKTLDAIRQRWRRSCAGYQSGSQNSTFSKTAFTNENIDRFSKVWDVVVDGLEFIASIPGEAVHSMRKRRIPVLRGSDRIREPGCCVQTGWPFFRGFLRHLTQLTRPPNKS